MRLRRTNLLAAPLMIGLQLMGCLFFSWSAQAKTFVVNTTLDETDVNPRDGISSKIASNPGAQRS